MRHISPITPAEVKPYIGSPIRLWLRDGSEITGYVRGVNKGTLLVGSKPEPVKPTTTTTATAGKKGASAAATRGKKPKLAARTTKAKAAAKQKQASIAASPRYPVTVYPEGVVALDLNFVAAFVADRF